MPGRRGEGCAQVAKAPGSVQLVLFDRRPLALQEIRHRQPCALAKRVGQEGSLVVTALSEPITVDRHRHQGRGTDK